MRSKELCFDAAILMWCTEGFLAQLQALHIIQLKLSFTDFFMTVTLFRFVQAMIVVHSR